MKTMLRMMIWGVLLTGLRAQEAVVVEAALVEEEEAGVVGEAVVDETVAQAESRPLSGTISEVTLYQGNALVSREVVIPAGPVGPMEILVSPLPTATDPSTVFADNGQGVEIRSVSCRTRPTDQAEERQGEVAGLEAAILEAEQKIANSNNEIALRRICTPTYPGP
jgi:hypothetical protein